MCCSHKVDFLWSDRYIPVKENHDIEPLDEVSTKEYVHILQEQRLKYKDFRLDVQNFRGLQFLCADTEPYFCMAGENLIVVDEKGNIMPCRRMPIVCSNIYDRTLKDVYFRHHTFLALREHTVSGKCIECKYSESCKGGERCLAYAINNDFCSSDPGCWL